MEVAAVAHFFIFLSPPPWKCKESCALSYCLSNSLRLFMNPGPSSWRNSACFLDASLFIISKFIWRCPHSCNIIIFLLFCQMAVGETNIQILCPFCWDLRRCSFHWGEPPWTRWSGLRALNVAVIRLWAWQYEYCLCLTAQKGVWLRLCV